MDNAVSTATKQIKNSKHWAEALPTAKSVAKNLKVVGYFGAAVGTVLGLYELGLSEGKASDWAKFLTGAAITGISVIPYVGLPTAIILGSYEAQGGFDSFYESYDIPHPDTVFSIEKMYGEATFLGH